MVFLIVFLVHNTTWMDFQCFLLKISSCTIRLIVHHSHEVVIECDLGKVFHF